MRKFLLVFPLIVAWAQQPPPEPKNLKVLKVPSSELMPIMRSFSAGLGVKCDFCHVKGDFASDDNPHKDIARKMILMSQHINSNFPDGKMHVTCYTCHRGEEEPKTEPPAGDATAPKHEHDHKH